ncbi:hypothetical protein E4K67_04280 [Desulfosporosinus fructosivorans]|uniref:ParB/Sulfiredoxin domain-containing protein n=1 Tax=Desulfosporosinus fructosivorans TaxID=2018669 RepID=A0A4Z0R8X2_9FIRM|nr:hypothetical protein [Desulfosporosinus fructosivorans]TGE38709.1 hypothetical protein E4K67_04280 [Desulfosporosinus fructosivorans]
MDIELHIDQRFRDLLPPLSQEEFTKLEELILEEGCTESLKVWTDNTTETTYIIDGHNRHNICTKHNLEFRITEMEFNTHEDVLDWIIKHQFARRNINDETKAYLRGFQYENEKNKWGGTGANQFNSRVEHSATLQNESEGETKNELFPTVKTAERIGKEHQVSERTIREDGKYAVALNIIGDTFGIKAKNIILNKEKIISKQDVINIGNQIKNGTADIEVLRKEILESEDKKINVPIRERQERKQKTPKPKVDKVEIDDSQKSSSGQEAPPLEPKVKVEVEKINTSTETSQYQPSEAVIKDMKTPKIFMDYLVVSDELLSIKSCIQDQIRIAHEKIFNRYNLPEIMTAEDKSNFVAYMDEIIENLVDLKNKFK